MNLHNSSIDDYKKYMLPVLDFRSIIIEKGQGSYVWDCNGNQYLDLNSGQFCSVFGHSDPGIANQLSHISNTIQDTDTSTLSKDVLIAAKKIHGITPEMNSRVLFLSTGAEANECCLKYAKHLKEKDGIVAFDRGYHGLTHGTAGYSMSRSRIRPTLDHSFTVSVPQAFYEDDLNKDEIDTYVSEFETVISNNIDHIAAAIFEPIVSGGGFYFPPKYYFQRIREICDRYEIFLIFDECQTGFGRTGSWFYYQQIECIPDFIVTAKAIGLGFPVASVIANGNTINNDRFLMQHFSSHQNEPFSGSLISYGIDRINNEDILNNNIRLGNYLIRSLNTLSNHHKQITAPRGKGLMCAFDLSFPDVLNDSDYKIIGENFCLTALNHGLLLQHCNNGKTIRLLPNFKVTESEIDECMNSLNDTISEFTFNNYEYKCA